MRATAPSRGRGSVRMTAWSVPSKRRRADQLKEKSSRRRGGRRSTDESRCRTSLAPLLLRGYHPGRYCWSSEHARTSCCKTPASPDQPASPASFPLVPLATCLLDSAETGLLPRSPLLVALSAAPPQRPVTLHSCTCQPVAPTPPQPTTSLRQVRLLARPTRGDAATVTRNFAELPSSTRASHRIADGPRAS